MSNNTLESKSVELIGVIKELIEEERTKLAAKEKELEEVNRELETMDKSDASENAPLQAARDTQAMCNSIVNLLNRRIKSMEEELVDYTPSGFIQRGTTVEVSIAKTPEGLDVPVGTKFTFMLVNHDTSKAKRQLVAIDSKLGAALLSRVEGDEVEIKAPAGLIQYKVERIY